MFSGIIEFKSKVIDLSELNGAFKVRVERPKSFEDICLGDSVAVNGVCLTVEEFDSQSLSFTIGYETLLVTHWIKEDLATTTLNLERSLKFGDRIHGHLVSGHVDAMAILESLKDEGECKILKLSFPQEYSVYIWKKGSVTLNGVSLTVNNVAENTFEVCLIPETIRQTNLCDLNIGSSVCFEIDHFARAMFQFYQAQNLNFNVKEQEL